MKIRELSRREFLAVSGMTGAGLVVAGCGGGETIGGEEEGGGDGQPQEGGTFTFGRGSDSVTLDPIHATDGESLIVCRQIFDGLLDFEPETTDLVPALAVEVPEPEEDGLVYTFPLREGVTFHDGTPFNAEAVVFNFERWMNSGNEYHAGGGPQASDFSYYSGMFGGFDEESIIESVEAVDEYTVRFRLREPQGPFLRNIAMSPFGIASPAAIQEDVEEFWRNPVGTGPFRFVEWNQGSTVRLEKNEEWWGTDVPVEEGGGGPFVDEVVFQSIDDNTSRVAALAGGQLSGADGLTPDDVPTIEQDPNLKVIFRPPLNVGYLAMHTQKEPFNDVNVRRAINHAIDMEAIVQAFFGETGEVATNPMPPTVPFFNEGVERYPYDPDRARELLAEAGYEDGFDTELWFMPIPRPYMPDGRGIAQAIASDLQEVGINCELVTFEWGTYIERTGRGEHPMALLGWTGDNGDPDNFLNIHFNSANATEENALNIAYYENDEVDELLNRGASTIDEGEREEAYMRVQEIIMEDAPWVTIAYTRPPLGFQNRVQGYLPSPTGGESFNSVYLSG
ncbi:ABC transporter substrate-binding protein [Rubrobacter taiwanensis]|jgi:peptide/nickel transport system substrate-binding protein|nr:ABC transporter substrate-binding protein [Rubrobacter taiwanensis]